MSYTLFAFYKPIVYVLILLFFYVFLLHMSV